MRVMARLCCLMLLIMCAPPGNAQEPSQSPSVELANAFKKYQSLNKAGKYGEALPHAKRALELAKSEFGLKHVKVGVYTNYLAGVYQDLGHYSKAELHYKRSLKILEDALGPKHVDVAHTLNDLASLYGKLGRDSEAERLFKHSLKIAEGMPEPNLILVATGLNNLANIYDSQGRYSEAEPLLGRSIKILEKVFGPKHSHIGMIYNNYAWLNMRLKRYVKAEKHYKRSIKILKNALGTNHSIVGTTINNLARLYRNQGRYNEAELHFSRSLHIMMKALDPEHSDVAIGLNEFAKLYHVQRRYSEAETLYSRSLKIYEKQLGPDHIELAFGLNNLAALYFLQSDWDRAVDYWRRATDVLTRRFQRNGSIGRGVTGKKQNEITRYSYFYRSLVKSVYRDDEGNRRTPSTINYVFETAQWALLSEAAGALAQMAARGAAGSKELAAIVWKRQDSVRQWQTIDKRIDKVRGTGRTVNKLQAKLADIDRRITTIDKQLSKDFPDYAALVNPKPLTIKQAQQLLGPDEALILLLDTPEADPTPEETFVWAITSDKAIWERSALGGKVLRDRIAALRKSLTSKNARAGNFLGIKPNIDQFDLTIAHELYQQLLGPVEKLIKGKRHLMVVASGPLTALPFHLLVKQKPGSHFGFKTYEKYGKADWLLRHHAVTTLPSVSSLNALRGIRIEKATTAPEPLIGFADPMFQQPSAMPARLASTAGEKNSVTREYAAFFKGRNANLSSLAQSLPQIGGTRRELLTVGKILNVPLTDLYLGRRASEATVKNVDLIRYRIVYFATHGLIAGDVKGLGEPALAFSLPAKATPVDDGLLTASEITELKLNAEWLVMSACNTAAGDSPGAEALSGLARAFFYAGAKTLLVSHWPVDDRAAVALTTFAFEKIQKQPKIGRAEALRLSMLALIDRGGSTAHPSYWAPFIIVGEGGAGR